MPARGSVLMVIRELASWVFLNQHGAHESRRYAYCVHISRENRGAAKIRCVCMSGCRIVRRHNRQDGDTSTSEEVLSVNVPHGHTTTTR